MGKHLTFTVLFEGSNLNYGEGFGNILSLKKLSNRGRSYSYVSRQALRYDIVRIMNEEFGLPLTTVGKDGKVVQFDKEATIDKFPEIDLFGYMKTGSNCKNKGSKQEIRKAVVRLTDAVSIEPYNNDMDFGNNMGLAGRDPKNEGNDLFQSEIHKSFYSYTATIDLEKIGIDDNYRIKLKPDEKKRRIILFLDAVKLLYRDIRGKRENLSPCFIIGGVYDSGNPFFYNKVKLNFSKEGVSLNKEMLVSQLAFEVNEKAIKNQTRAGSLQGTFINIDSIGITVSSIEDFFKKIKKEIDNCF